MPRRVAGRIAVHPGVRCIDGTGCQSAEAGGAYGMGVNMGATEGVVEHPLPVFRHPLHACGPSVFSPSKFSFMSFSVMPHFSRIAGLDRVAEKR